MTDEEQIDRAYERVAGRMRTGDKVSVPVLRTTPPRFGFVLFTCTSPGVIEGAYVGERKEFVEDK
jgi:hypothetical protein